MWTEAAMAKRLDYERRKFDRLPKASVTDETEFRQRDAAARWLAGAEKWEVTKAKLAKARKKKKRKRT